MITELTFSREVYTAENEEDRTKLHEKMRERFGRRAEQLIIRSFWDTYDYDIYHINGATIISENNPIENYLEIYGKNYFINNARTKIEKDIQIKLRRTR